MLEDVRSMFDSLRAELPIVLRPLNGPDWTYARFGLGPFPALLNLDEETGFATVVIALRGFYEAEKVAATLSEMNLPKPLLHDSDFVSAPTMAEYPIEFEEVTKDRALLLLLTSAKLAGSLVEFVPIYLEYGWQKLYSDYGLENEVPWQMLAEQPVPHYPWDDLDPDATPRTPQTVLANLSGGEWSDLDQLVYAFRNPEGDRIYDATESLHFIRRSLLVNGEGYLRPEENARPIEEWSADHTLATLSRMFYFEASDFERWMRSFDDGTTPRLLRRVLTFEPR